MSTLVQRTYPRIELDTPIQYAAADSNEFHTSHSLNFSAGGLCYEMDQPFEPMAEVCIVMKNYEPGRNGPEGYRSYLARICWIQPLRTLREGQLAAGAQIIARSHEVLANGTSESRHMCDLCGVLMPVSRLFDNDGDVQLCEHCQRHFLSIPKGKLRQCLNRYLMGNVA